MSKTKPIEFKSGDSSWPPQTAKYNRESHNNHNFNYNHNAAANLNQNELQCQLQRQQTANLIPQHKHSDKHNKQFDQTNDSPIKRKFKQTTVGNGATLFNFHNNKSNKSKLNSQAEQEEGGSTSSDDTNFGFSDQNNRATRSTTGESSSLTTILKSSNNVDGCGEKGTKTILQKFFSITLFIMQLLALLIVIDLIIYLWPIGGETPEIQPRAAPYRPRPKFTGPLELNELLDERADILFRNQFHAPESMAWTNDKRSFYTGVEGGFILLVEPYEERWSIVARLNSRHWPVKDLSQDVRFAQQTTTANSAVTYDNDNDNSNSNSNSKSNRIVPFCTKDIELYGKRAEFEPKLVYLSRCSRPLGIRLSPDNSYLYSLDPFSGLYKIHLDNNKEKEEEANEVVPKRFNKLARVSKLIDFTNYHQEALEMLKSNSENYDSTSRERIIFGDDIAVDWAKGENNSDIIYMSDCSRRVSLRYLFRVLAENDDSGRIIRFNSFEKKLYPLDNITPVRMKQQQVNNLPPVEWSTNEWDFHQLDKRNLSFPNGIELNANGDALLISDLNNRRIIKHYLRGDKMGQTEHLLWVPGYPDNIRRGLNTLDGRPTYWAACGCAVSDGKFEFAEFFNDQLHARKVFLKSLHLIGATIESIGSLFNSTCLKDMGFLVKSFWLKKDPYCTHGIVFQFTEDGQILRSLQGQSYTSDFRLLSEAHEVPLLDGPHFNEQDQQSNNLTSQLFLGSVYYPYLGKIQLGPI